MSAGLAARGFMRRVGAVTVAAIVAFVGALIALPAPAVANPIFPPTCTQVGKPYFVDSWTQFEKAGPSYHLEGPPGIPAHQEKIVYTWSETKEFTLSVSLGLEFNVFFAKAKTEFGASVKKSETISRSHEFSMTLQPGDSFIVEYGFKVGYLKYRRNFSPPGCNKDLTFLPVFADTATFSAPYGQGWNIRRPPGPQGRPAPPEPGQTNPPSPPKPEPVTSVYGLADGTVLHTTDTKRIYKMVGGAPVWQATCDGGICLPESRPTTQAVINAGPDFPRNGSSAIDQRGRVYIFVGGAPLWQTHCSAPVNCGTPVKISDWSIDARDHMNERPADRQLIQGWTGNSATPVAQTVGGARINFASPQEVLDTGFGANWASQVVIVSTGSFEALGTVPRDGTLLQGTAGGAATPVAMFAGGARINFASPQEVVETGYGNDWASKVRAIPKRAFDAMMADVPPDRTLVQGISNGVATPVAMMVGGTRINFANPDEVVAVGYGANWRSQVHAIPTRAFNMISDGPPVDGTLIQGAGGAPTPVAQMLGGGRMNFASPQEVIDAGHGTEWGRKVHAIPTRAFNAIHEGISDGVRVKKAGATTQAAIVGGAALPFASTEELQASSFAELTMWSVPDRIWNALPTRPTGHPHVRAAETGTLFRFFHGEADLAGQCPAQPGCDEAITLGQSMIDRSAQGVSNRGPVYGTLARYYNGNDHYSSVGSVPAGYRPEYVFGLLSPTATSGAVPLYGCRTGEDTFTSLSANCEGWTVVGQLGWIYTDPPQGQPSRAVYRCKNNSSGEHFDSLSETCEGHTTEFRLGYVLAYAQVTRYNKGGDRRTSTTTVAAGYQPEGAFGMLPQVSQPGTIALYACEINGEGFTSTSEICENRTVLGRIGFIYTSPPQGLPSVAMYRCLNSSGTEHFDSLDATCGGAPNRMERRLGYLVGRKILTRGMRGSDHRTAAGVFPPGFRHEWTFGYLADGSEPGTRALYSCQAGSDAFTSHDAACEGYQVLGLLGSIWQQPPSGVASRPVYRCMLNGTNEHFDSLSETCEGHRTEFQLGYVGLAP